MNKLSTEIKEKINILKTKYPETEACIIPSLHLIHDVTGYITAKHCSILGEFLEISPIKILETASFYSMFNKKEIGKYHIQVCRNISCSLKGSKKLMEILENNFSIIPEKTTDDNLFTLTPVECLGSCGTSPVIMINNEYHESMTEEKLIKLIEKLKSDEGGVNKNE